MDVIPVGSGMKNPHYSTKTAFDWLLSHYFFHEVHFAWVAPEFFPYRLPNPCTSNPLKIYEAFYAAWADKDEFSPWVAQKRISLRKVVDLKAKAGIIDDQVANSLKDLIDSADASLFYPIVYVLDLARIGEPRLRVSGSGLSRSSQEYFIGDLAEGEFSLLFGHFRNDPELGRMVLEIPRKGIYLDSYQVTDFILNRKIVK